MKIVNEQNLPQTNAVKKESAVVRLKNWFNGLSRNRRLLIVFLSSVLTLTLLILLGYGIYSYASWNTDNHNSEKVASSSAKVKVAEKPKYESPINGIYYDKETFEEFDSRRPMAVMVNNHSDARPYQKGLSDADVIYEAVAEGGITRFLSVFQAKKPEVVGPVRSARVYYADWESEFFAWYAHFGAADTKGSPANVYDYMAKNGIGNLDGMRFDTQPINPFWRDESLKYKVASEHTAFTSIPKLYEMAKVWWKGWAAKVPFDRWLFKDDAASAERPASGSLSFNFWNIADYAVSWTYDPNENVYLRSQGGKPHTDAATNTQIKAKDVVVQFTDEKQANDGTVHLLYQTVGSGTAKVFMDGKMIEATWKKDDRTSRTRYYVAPTGEEIKFNRGQIWVEIVPTGKEITYSQ